MTVFTQGLKKAAAAPRVHCSPPPTPPHQGPTRGRSTLLLSWVSALSQEIRAESPLTTLPSAWACHQEAVNGLEGCCFLRGFPFIAIFFCASKSYSGSLLRFIFNQLLLHVSTALGHLHGNTPWDRGGLTAASRPRTGPASGSPCRGAWTGKEAGRCAPVTSISPTPTGLLVPHTRELPLSLQPPDRPPLL